MSLPQALDSEAGNVGESLSSRKSMHSHSSLSSQGRWEVPCLLHNFHLLHGSFPLARHFAMAWVVLNSEELDVVLQALSSLQCTDAASETVASAYLKLQMLAQEVVPNHMPFTLALGDNSSVSSSSSYVYGNILIYALPLGSDLGY